MIAEVLARRGLLWDIDPKENSFEFFLYIVICSFLVLMAGLMSGLTLGLLSLDMLDLEVSRHPVCASRQTGSRANCTTALGTPQVLKRSGTEKERFYASRIVPVIKNNHWLLVTLVLGNAACTEALPIFLDRLTHPVTAVIISVTVVLLFGARSSTR